MSGRLLLKVSCFFILSTLMPSYADHPQQDRPPWIPASLWTQCCAGAHCRKTDVKFIAERKGGLVLVEIDGEPFAVPKDLVRYGPQGWVCNLRDVHLRPAMNGIRCLWVPPRLDF